MWPAANVLNQFIFNEVSIYLLVTIADKELPLPRTFPIVITSGVWFCHLNPQPYLPILPKPVPDSSHIVTPLFYLKYWTVLLIYWLIGNLTPAFAWIG